MGHRQDLPRTLIVRASERAGVLARTELLAGGVSSAVADRMARQWATIIPGVYCLDARPGTAPGKLPHAVRVEAGLLHAGPGAVAGGLTAAFLDGLVDREPRVVTVQVPRRRVAPVAGWSFVRVTPGHRAPPRPLSPRRTLMEDTVLDVVALADAAAAISLVAAACQRRLTTATRLAARLRARSRQRHRAVLLDVLEDVGAGSHSQLELRYLRSVERAHRLPASVRQFVAPGSTHPSDGAYPELKILIEHDGRAFHTGPEAFRDMDLDNAAAVAAWLTLRYGWLQVAGTPCRVARQVVEALRSRGWRGRPSPCSESCEL